MRARMPSCVSLGSSTARSIERDSDRFFVITGGPGTGKTAIVDALAAAGYSCSTDSARAIARDQVAIGGTALPWGDAVLFAELTLSAELCSHRLARERSGVVVFDRGLPDVIAHLRLVGAEVPRRFVRAAARFRYNTRVFIAPPWREIQRDATHGQDYAECVRTHEVLAETYAGYGYELFELPRVPVVDRAEIVAQAALGVERRLFRQRNRLASIPDQHDARVRLRA